MTDDTARNVGYRSADRSLEDDATLAALLSEKPRIVSFHFGLPSAERIRALRESGIVLLATATNSAEGRTAAKSGVHAVVAQGYEAGGHRGVFDPGAQDDCLGTLALTRVLVRELDVPVIERSHTALDRDAKIWVIRDDYASLSHRERQVMELVVRCLLNKQVGGQLGISEITVKAHRGRVMQKMKADSLVDLVNMAATLRLALLPRPWYRLAVRAIPTERPLR